MKFIKNNLLNICLVLIGLFIAFGLSEIFVRTFFPYSKDHVIPGGLFEVDEHLGWKFNANKSATHRSRYFNVTYAINELGYRDKPNDSLKASIKHRILLFGDSQIFGWGIPENQRFDSPIENQDSSLEVLTLAVPGYGLDQQVLSYEKYGNELKPNDVVFFLSNATLSRIHFDYIYKKPKPKFFIDQHGELKLSAVRKGSHFWTNFSYKLLSPLYLPYFLERQIAILRQSREKQPADSKNDEQGQENNHEEVILGETEKNIIIKAKNLAKERKHRIIVMIYLPNDIGQAWQNCCRSNEINVLNLGFYNKRAEFVLGKHDAHWNKQAHELIAEKFIEFYNL